MTKIEKAMQMEIEGLEARIVNTYCPHQYKMNDRATSSNFACDGHCKECWNEEVEGDSGAGTET